jgi:uncharacterized protein
MEFVWAVLLLVALLVAWATNLIGLPGNWLMLACAVVYWLLVPPGQRASIGSTVLIVMALLATVGELIEIVAGMAGVSKAGGHPRSALYALLGSIVGGILGLGLGLPIPIIGPLVGALLFASLGAMAGAMLGEHAAGRDWDQMLTVGRAAFIGRALGTLAKMFLGLIMIAAVLAGLLI